MSASYNSDKFYSYCKDLYEGYEYPHDFHHVETVLKYAMMIHKKEGGNWGIIKYSALLHDVGHPHKQDGKTHADVGAEMSSNILRKFTKDEEYIDAVYWCVKTHSYNSHRPRSKEAEIVADADRLEALGQSGFDRSLAMCIQMGYSIEQTINYFKRFEDPVSLMYTSTGKKLAEIHVPSMKKFFNSLETVKDFDELRGHRNLLLPTEEFQKRAQAICYSV
jgi:putative nucleotidyltransferase with HDIG domain